MRLWRCEAGSVSVEFVIVLPVLLAIFVFIGTASHLYAVSSDIQQTSFELARRSIAMADTEGSPTAACAKLLRDYTHADVARIGVFLSEENVKSLSCVELSRNFVSVEISYDVSNNPVVGLGRLVGIKIDTLSRKTVIGL